MGYHDYVEIKTSEQATNFVLEKVQKVEQMRAVLDQQTMLPESDRISKEEHNKLYDLMLTQHGMAVGTMVALVHTRVLNPAAYEGLHQRVMHATAKRTLTVLPS